MIPRMILMTLIRKDQNGKNHPSAVTSFMIFLVAVAMLGVEIAGSKNPKNNPVPIPQVKIADRSIECDCSEE